MDALIYLAKSSAILGLFFLIYSVFLNKETFFKANRIYLVSGVFVALILPFVSIKKTVYVAPTPLITDVLKSTEFIQVAAPATEPTAAINWIYVFGVLYALGVLFMFGKFVIQIISVCRMIKQQPVVKEHGIYYVKTHKDHTPFSFFNYIVYNPDLFTKEELDIILKHEKIHSKDQHSVDILIAKIIQIVQWLNPFAWWYQKAIVQNLEYLADKKATSTMECRKLYQFTLLKATNYHQIPITNNFFNSLIKNRIIMLKQHKSKNRNMLKMALIGPLLVAFVFIFNTEISAQEQQNAPNPVVPTPELPPTPAPAPIPDPAPISELINENEVEVIKFKIHKKTTKADLNDIKKQLKEEGIEFKFKKLKFNDNNELTSISVSAKNKGNAQNYAVSSDEPIAAFYITVKDGNVSISGHSSQLSWKHKKAPHIKGHHYKFMTKESDSPHEEHEIIIEKEGDEDGVIILNGKKMDLMGDFDINIGEIIDGEQIALDIESDGKVMTINGEEIDLEQLLDKTEHMKILELSEDRLEEMEDKLQKMKIKLKNDFIFFEEDENGVFKKRILKLGDGNHEDDNIFWQERTNAPKSKQFHFVDDPDIEKLIIIDGQEADFEKLDALAKEDKLDAVEFLKSKTAMSIYGEKAKDGAIIATTKE